MENFTPLSATLGGVLIGLAAAMMLLFHGRITGVSGVLGGLLAPKPGELGWQLTFTAGLLVGGLALGFALPDGFAVDVIRSPAAIVSAGVIVGFGTRLGSGCTSGHGVCGLARLSPRSLASVATFMATGILTVFVIRHLLGVGA
jgi:uncharacterized membrane protein YedE/YeeE